MSRRTSETWDTRRFAPSPPLRTSGRIPFEQAMAYVRGCTEMMSSTLTIGLLARAAAAGMTLDALTARWHAEMLEHCGLDRNFAAHAFHSGADATLFDFAPAGASSDGLSLNPPASKGAAGGEEEQWAEFTHALAELEKGTISLISGVLHHKPWRCRRFAPARVLCTAAPVDPALLARYASLSTRWLGEPETVEALYAAARGGEHPPQVLAKWKCELLESCGIERSLGLSTLEQAAAARALTRTHAHTVSRRSISPASPPSTPEAALVCALGASAAAERALLIVASLPDVRASGAQSERRFRRSPAGTRADDGSAGARGPAESGQLQTSGPLDVALPGLLVRELLPLVHAPGSPSVSRAAAVSHGAPAASTTSPLPNLSPPSSPAARASGSGSGSPNGTDHAHRGSALLDEAQRARLPAAHVLATWTRELLEAHGVEQDHGMRELSTLAVRAAARAEAEAPAARPGGRAALGVATPKRLVLSQRASAEEGGKPAEPATTSPAGSGPRPGLQPPASTQEPSDKGAQQAHGRAEEEEEQQQALLQMLRLWASVPSPEPARVPSGSPSAQLAVASPSSPPGAAAGGEAGAPASAAASAGGGAALAPAGMPPPVVPVLPLAYLRTSTNAAANRAAHGNQASDSTHSPRLTSSRVAVPPLGLHRAARGSALSAHPQPTPIALHALPPGAAAALLAGNGALSAPPPPVDPVVSNAQTNRPLRPGSARARVRPGWRPPQGTTVALGGVTPRGGQSTPLPTPRTPLPTPRALTLAHRTLLGASVVKMAAV